MKAILTSLLLLFLLYSVCGQDQAVLAFYNLENLFDTRRDTTIWDEDWTPDGRQAWTGNRYDRKLRNLSKALSGLSTDIGQIPSVIGVCEVENHGVLRDLISTGRLSKYRFGIIHHDSPDRRGIDVAVLYQKKDFRPLHWNAHRLLLKSPEGQRKYTRDILVVHGILRGEPLYVLVNHWPSRSGGIRRSQGHRMQAAERVCQILDSIQRLDSKAKIAVMGDLNDNPTDSALSALTGLCKTPSMGYSRRKSERLYNPYLWAYELGWGTLAHNSQWQLYDQILISQTLKEAQQGWAYLGAGIYAPQFLWEGDGPFTGSPKRTYSYGSYRGGFSDHFPVYVVLSWITPQENHRSQGMRERISNRPEP